MGVIIAIAAWVFTCGLLLFVRGVYMVHMQTRVQHEKYKIYIMTGAGLMMGGVAVPIQMMIQGL